MMKVLSASKILPHCHAGCALSSPDAFSLTAGDKSTFQTKRCGRFPDRALHHNYQDEEWTRTMK